MCRRIVQYKIIVFVYFIHFTLTVAQSTWILSAIVSFTSISPIWQIKYVGQTEVYGDSYNLNVANKELQI